jgi:hypothetical protein
MTDCFLAPPLETVVSSERCKRKAVGEKERERQGEGRREKKREGEQLVDLASVRVYLVCYLH